MGMTILFLAVMVVLAIVDSIHSLLTTQQKMFNLQKDYQDHKQQLSQKAYRKMVKSRHIQS